MNVIVSERQSGKTHSLVQWVKDGEETDPYPGWSRIILTHSLEESNRIRDLYKLDYRQVFSVNEWKNAHLGSKPVEVAVDNADMILTFLIGQSPSIVVMTGRREKLNSLPRI